MGLKVFVTRELFPFTPGGIGRAIANILQTASPAERAGMAVLYVGDGIDEGAFSQVYPEATFLAWPGTRYAPLGRDGCWYPPRDAFADRPLYWESIHVAQGLQELARRHGPLDYVEFVDWGAAGVAASQIKALGRDFEGVTLAVRLHTTDSILADFEARNPDLAGLSLYDLERKALADCDLVVGQLATVAEAIRTFYGFDESDWSGRLRIHAPPVLLDTVPLAPASTAFHARTPLMFTSKLQDIKRPDVFVRGCVEFMRACPEYTGDAVFLAHSFDPAYQASIEALVPKSLRNRIVFARGVGTAARERRIAGSVCIFPSPWESFCLAAYEASLSGAICVLNAANPAFAEGTPWEAGLNCGKFDGSARDLAATLERLFRGGADGLVPVTLPADRPPWQAQPEPRPAEPAPRQRLDVVVVNRDSGAGLLRTVDSVLSPGASVQGLVVVDCGSADPRDRKILAELESVPRVRVHRLEGVDESVAFNAGLDGLEEGGLVAFVQAGDRFAPGFLDEAARALAAGTTHDVVVGQAVVSAGDLPPSDLQGLAGIDSQPSLFRIYHGDAVLAGLYSPLHGPLGFVTRTALARRHRFQPMPQDLGAWELLMRLSQAGSRFLASPSVALAVDPHRAAVHAQAGVEARALARRLHGKRVAIGGVSRPAYALMGRVAPPSVVGHLPTGHEDAAERLRELMESETVRYTLALAMLLSRRAPWVLRLGKWLARRARPVYLRLVR